MEGWHRLLAFGVAVRLLTTVVSAQRESRKVFVTAIDGRGAPVLDMTAADFTVSEGGQSREIQRARVSNEPMRVALVVDSSEDSAHALNEIRAALTAFLTRLPPEHEVVLITIGRQLRVRVQPTLDRARLLTEAKRFSADGAGTVLLDGARETNDRFMRKAEDRWPVMVVITTDGPETSGTTHEYYTNSYQPGIEKTRWTPEWFSTVARNESDIAGFSRITARQGQTTQSPKRHAANASLSYVTGSHNIKVGFLGAGGLKPQAPIFLSSRGALREPSQDSAARRRNPAGCSVPAERGRSPRRGGR